MKQAFLTAQTEDFLKLGINACGCNHGRSGAGSYLRSLVQHLPTTEHTIQLFGPEIDKYTYSSGVEGVSYVGLPVEAASFSEKMWHQTHFLSFVKKHAYDKILFPAGTQFLPKLFPVPTVLMIQGRIDVKQNFFSQLFAKKMLKMNLHTVAGFIVPSTYVKKKLLDFGIPESKIEVIYHGVDRKLFFPHPLEDDEPLLIQPFSIQRPYIIYASRMSDAEKYHIQLIHAFNLFKQKTGSPYRLVLAGESGQNAHSVHDEVLKSPFASDILLTGYFPHEQLPELYSAADLCVFPSAIEGVGLPILEAMACGIPTACAHAGALPEIIGKSTVFFNPDSVEEIAHVIENHVKLKSGENDGRRNALIEGGLEWVKKYNWETTAQKTLDYLNSI